MGKLKGNLYWRRCTRFSWKFWNFRWKFALNSVTILIKIRIKFLENKELKRIFYLRWSITEPSPFSYFAQYYYAVNQRRSTCIFLWSLKNGEALESLVGIWPSRVSPVLSIWLRWDLHKVHCVIGASRMRVQCIISFVYVPSLRKSVLTS